MGAGASKKSVASKYEAEESEDEYEDEEEEYENGSDAGVYEDEQQYQDEYIMAGPSPPRNSMLRLPEEAPNMEPLEVEAELQAGAADRHATGFVGRRETLEQLVQHSRSLGAVNPLVLHGPPGCGKSAVVSTFLSELQGGGRMGSPSRTRALTTGLSHAEEDAGEPFVLYHLFGVNGFSSDLRHVLLRFCIELHTRFNIYLELPETVSSLPETFVKFLIHASLFARVVVVLDGLDQAEFHSIPLDFLPVSLPLAVRCIITCGKCPWLSHVQSHRAQSILFHEVGPLAEEERRGIVTKALVSVSGGRFSASDLEVLLQNEDAGKPLYLLLAIEEVKQIAREVKDPEQVVEAANSLPDTLHGLIARFCEHIEGTFGMAFTADAFGMLCCAHTGMSNDEALKMLRRNEGMENLQAVTWQAFTARIERLCWPVDRLMGCPPETRMLFHKTIRHLISRRYFENAGQQRAMHKKLTLFFAEQPADARSVDEILWGQVSAEDWTELHITLLDPKTVGHLSIPETLFRLVFCFNSLVKGGKMNWSDLTNSFIENAMSMFGGAAQDYAIETIIGMAAFLSTIERHAESATLLEYIVEQKGDAIDDQMVPVLGTLGKSYLALGRHQEAGDAFHRAYQIEERLNGQETPALAEQAVGIARTAAAADDLEGAGQYHAQACAIWEAAEQAGFEEAKVTVVSQALVRLAASCDELNRVEDAERAYERSLERLEQMFGPDHPEVTELLAVMASSYRMHGEWQKAEFCYCRALAFAHRFYGPSSIPVSYYYNGLAELYRSQGDLQHAQALYQRALQIVEQVLGMKHPECATYLNNLAELSRVQGLLAEAEPLYKRALAIDEAAFGDRNPTIAIRLNNLAELYRDQGLLDQALPLCERALAIDRAALGSSHPNIATYYNNLAGMHKACGNFEQAEEYYNKALAIDEKELGSEHPDVAIYLNNLAGLYKLQGRLEDAEPLYLRALRINEEALGEDHTDIAIYYNNLALLYKAQGRLDEAEMHYVRAIEIGEQTLGDAHPQMATRYANLGALKFERQDWQGAEMLFKQALDIRGASLGEEHPDTIACLDWLDAILEATEQPQTLDLVAAEGDEAVAIEYFGAADAAAAEEYDPDLVREAARREQELHTEEQRMSEELAEALSEQAKAESNLDLAQADVIAAQARVSAGEQGAEVDLEKAQARISQSQELAAAASEKALRLEEMKERLLKKPLHVVRRASIAAGVSSEERELAALKVLEAEEQETEVVKQRMQAARRMSWSGAITTNISAMRLARRSSVSSTSGAPPPRLSNPGRSPSPSKDDATPMENDAANAEGETANPAVPPLEVPEPRVKSGGEPGYEGPASPLAREAYGQSVVSDQMLDAFMSAHVEYLGGRQYRCTLDGKVFSTFNLMRVYIAKKFPEQIRKWSQPDASETRARKAEGAAEPAPLAVAATSPTKKPELTIAIPATDAAAAGEVPQLPPLSAVRDGVNELEAAERQRRDGEAGAGAGAGAEREGANAGPPASARTTALRRVQELEEELRRMQMGLGRVPLPQASARTMALRRVEELEAEVRRLQSGGGGGGGDAAAAAAAMNGSVGPAPTPFGGGYVFMPPSTGAYPGFTPWQLPYAVPPPSTAYPPSSLVGGDPASPLAKSIFGQPALKQPPSPNLKKGAAKASVVADMLASPKGLDFSSMLAAERGSNPFKELAKPASKAASVFPAKAFGDEGEGERGGGDARSPSKRAQDSLDRLLQGGKVDPLGLFMSARSRQEGRRAFVCEIDGKTFSTMNLMRIHFERVYAQQAADWWASQNVPRIRA